MNNDDPRWLQHLDDVTDRGQHLAYGQRPRGHPSDQQLWAQARSHTEMNLPDQVDSALLHDLRRAFELGYHRHCIDLDALADALVRRGHDAVVTSTNGFATLYAGEPGLDRHGEWRWSLAAGPGWFEGPDHTEPFAYIEALAIGPDHDLGWTIRLPEMGTWTAMTEVLIAVIDHVETGRSRLRAATDAAMGAMWTTFAQQYPEIAASVVPQETCPVPLEDEATKLFTAWLDDHWPTLPTVPPHLAHLAHRGF